jgi:hypothetical protein
MQKHLQIQEEDNANNGSNICICPQHVQQSHPDTSGTSLEPEPNELSQEPKSPEVIDLECMEVLPDDISNDEIPSPNANKGPLDPEAVMELERENNSLKRRCYKMEKRIEKAKEFQERHYKYKRENKLLHLRKDRTILGLERTIKDVLAVKL